MDGDQANATNTQGVKKSFKGYRKANCTLYYLFRTGKRGFLKLSNNEYIYEHLEQKLLFVGD